jgi:hypothetical protein
MNAIATGLLAGAVLSGTTSYLITGRLFHRFQAATPATWRRESARRHAVAMSLQALAGAALGGTYMLAGAPGISLGLLALIACAWLLAAAIVLIQAVYVHWLPGFVAGLLIEWLATTSGVLVACAIFDARPSP